MTSINKHHNQENKLRADFGSGVSLALVVRNEQKNISKALPAIDSPDCDWEILIVDNGSTDGTYAAVKQFRENNPAVPIRWLSHSPNNLGAARAFAVEQAAFPIIAFLDADCIPPEDWLGRARDALLSHEKNPWALGLGGGNRPPTQGDSFHEALAIQWSSLLGHLNLEQAKVATQAGEVGHVPTCNALYFRERLIEAGNFSPKFELVCEDLELSRRARARGYKLFFQPGLDVVHAPTPTLGAWSKKMFRYGWGQIEVAKLHHRHLLGLKAAPLIAILVAVAWLGIHPASFLVFVLLYLAITAAYSAGIAFAHRKLRLSGYVFCLFVTTHFFYSAGELWGLLRQIKRRKVQH